MEEYAADGLAASGQPGMRPAGMAAVAAAAEAVEPGTGPLVVRLIGLVRAAAGAVRLEEIEVLAVEGARDLGRGALQLALDAQADAEVLLPGLTGADGQWRGCREKSATTVVTVLGPVRVRRVAYRSRVKGAASLFWRDAVLNLPPCGYSWQLQKLAEMASRSGSYQLARELVAAATGVRIGKRQLEQIAGRAAADAEAFAGQRPVPEAPVLTGPDGERLLPVLVMSADGKGVPMRPGALRPETARKARKRSEPGKRLGSGEKAGNKRIAETGAVFDCLPPDGPPRTPGDIMTRPAGEPARSPQAVNRWYTCGITASRAETISLLFQEADRRDPGRGRDWLALADGDVHQIERFGKEAGKRGKTVTILIDFIHVLEYLWKAAWCFCPAGDTAAAERQVTAWGLAILHGSSREVIAEIRRQAAADPPRPGGEHDKNIRKTIGYLQAKEPCLDYPAALARGWPIATGVIEGACRHLVGDRMSITGARWSLPGAQAMLWMRAIHASGDLDPYWDHHIRAEHQRNHLSKFQDSHALAA